VSEKFIFKPWSDCAEQAKNLVITTVEEPPCKHCKFWNPRIRTDEQGKYAGVVLCTAEKMHSDFSCFKPKEGDTK
jgi:hypothetical protein